MPTVKASSKAARRDHVLRKTSHTIAENMQTTFVSVQRERAALNYAEKDAGEAKQIIFYSIVFVHSPIRLLDTSIANLLTSV